MLTLLVFIYSTLGFETVHDIHVGICDIRVEESGMEVTIKTFIDDLQIAVGLTPGQPLPDNYTSAQELISDYIKSTIQLKLDGELLTLELDDISSSRGDAIWITLHTYTKGPISDKLEVGFELLTDIYNDQTNIVNVYTNDEKEIYSLNSKKISFTYEPE